MSIYKMRTQFGGALKVLLILIAGGFLVGAIYSFGAAPSGGNGQRASGNDVIATVNGSEIQRSEFESSWERTMNMAQEQGIRSPLQLADAKARVFQDAVRSRLVLSAAKEMGVDVSDRRVEAEVEKAVTAYLNQNRDVILGKAKKGSKRPKDPRDDENYKRDLASINSSIAQQEEMIRSKIPQEQIRAQLAMQGIQAKIKSEVGQVSDAAVRDTYKTYKIQQLVLNAAGSTPKEQVSNQAKKIRDAAAGGEDFGKLVRANSEGPGKQNGGEMDLTWQTRWFMPREIRDRVEKMKPGDVSPVIDTQYGSYIVKLVSVAPTLPAKMDKKTMDARRKEIQQDLEMQKLQDFQQKMDAQKQVKVTDPELDGYWLLYEAQASFADRSKFEKHMKAATAALKKAVKERPNNSIAAAKLVQLLDQQGNTKEAVALLYPMLEGKNAIIEGADLRMLMGDMFAKQGLKDKATEQYKVASEVAIKSDVSTHQQLVTKFTELKRPDLVAAEQKLIEDYNQRQAQLKALETKTGAKPGAPAPTPKTPPSGG